MNENDSGKFPAGLERTRKEIRIRPHPTAHVCSLLVSRGISNCYCSFSHYFISDIEEFGPKIDVRVMQCGNVECIGNNLNLGGSCALNDFR